MSPPKQPSQSGDHAKRADEAARKIKESNVGEIFNSLTKANQIQVINNILEADAWKNMTEE